MYKVSMSDINQSLKWRSSRISAGVTSAASSHMRPLPDADAAADEAKATATTTEHPTDRSNAFVVKLVGFLAAAASTSYFFFLLQVSSSIHVSDSVCIVRRGGGGRDT